MAVSHSFLVTEETFSWEGILLSGSLVCLHTQLVHYSSDLGLTLTQCGGPVVASDCKSTVVCVMFQQYLHA